MICFHRDWTIKVLYHEGYRRYLAHATDQAGDWQLNYLGQTHEEAIAHARAGIDARLLRKNAPPAHTIALGRAQGGE